ncbi:MAG: divalent-cation tolerance protein CutA [Opitutales bacterium]
MTEVRIAFTTLPSREEADRLAAESVAAGLAACAQVEGPIRSHFTWEGRAESEEEHRVTFKFAAAKERDLESWVHARHPYAVPQWLTFAADHVSPAYRAWIGGVR